MISDDPSDCNVVAKAGTNGQLLTEEEKRRAEWEIAQGWPVPVVSPEDCSRLYSERPEWLTFSAQTPCLQRHQEGSSCPADAERPCHNCEKLRRTLALEVFWGKHGKPIHPSDVPQQDDASSGKFRFAVLSSAHFASAEYRREWLVRRLLVRGQPAVFGGPKKAMKTSLLVDLAISLGTATPFLGEFVVPRRTRVALLSAESGDATLQETALRVCAARGVGLATADVLWGFTLPKFCDPTDLLSFQDGLRKYAVKVVILDPLYLALLAGQGSGGLRAESLYDVGPLLLRVAQTCSAVGATLILTHHGTKSTGKMRDPLELEDLAYSGISEFARQWVLVSRSEAYEQGTGRHELWMNVGGSSGHGGLWSLAIDEGTVDEHFRGRRWEVRVSTAGEHHRAAQTEAAALREGRQQAQDRADDADLLRAIDRLTGKGEKPVYTTVRDLAGLSGPRMMRATARLTEEGIVEEVEVLATIGNGAQRKVKGLRRCPLE